MKHFRKLALFLVLILALGFASVTAEAASMSISQTSATLIVGKTVTLKILNKGTKIVTWTSSDKSVATVSTSGVVKGLKAGTAYISGKVGTSVFKCKVTVKNQDATATVLKFYTVNGGDFIKGVNNARIAFKLNYASTDVKVVIKNMSGTTVYSKTYSKCAANTAYSFYWDGIKSSGKTASSGLYNVMVVAGSQKTTSAGNLYFYAEKSFSAGDGSKENPYTVATLTQLKRVGRFNNRYFIQTENIDGKNTNWAVLFTEDNPFNGYYDGNGKTISSLYFRSLSDDGLFAVIGSKGVVKNLTMYKMHFVADDTDVWIEKSHGYIAGINYGTIKSCKAKTVDMKITNVGVRNGAICGTNFGRIDSCYVSNATVWCSRYSNNDSSAGGICAFNNKGTITNCRVVNFDAAMEYSWRVGGITVTSDKGTISYCRTEGTFKAPNSSSYCGYLVGYASGATIINCYDETGSGLSMGGSLWECTVQ